MTNTNVKEAIAVAMETKTVEFSYHFKSFNQTEKGYERLQELVKSEALAQTDVEVIEEEGKDSRFKRKSLTIGMEVPVISIDGFTSAQNAHMQQLVNRAIKTAQDEVVANGTPTAETLVGWAAMLESPFAQRTAQVKVTAEMVKAVVEVVKATMPDLFNQKVADAVAQLGEKRFSLASCQPVSNTVLEKLQGAVATWFKAIKEQEPEAAEQCEPVVNLWAANLEKVLKPSEEYNLDMFE